MNEEKAISILELIQALYPKYNLSKDKAKMLLPILLPMDYERVKKKLAAYAATYPYAPTIAEIADNPATPNEQLDKISAWREEASHVPDAIKNAFYQKMAKLLKDKAYARD